MTAATGDAYFILLNKYANGGPYDWSVEMQLNATTGLFIDDEVGTVHARGFDARPIRATFHLPDGSGWKVATQLIPTADPETFTAPSLQYFMDSPTELAPFVERSRCRERERMRGNHAAAPQERENLRGQV
jgi:predicted metalloprotease with PDZ domain